MTRLETILAVLLTLVLHAGIAYGQYPPECPAQGSGAAGVAAWSAANCGEGACVNPATTCNEDFSIELLSTTVDPTDADLVTFEYEVCKLVPSPVPHPPPPNLSHWVIGSAGIDCLGEGVDLEDLVVAATLYGAPLDLTTDVAFGVDPTTQLAGIKLDEGFNGAANPCAPYTITFDTSRLTSGFTLGTGCVTAATKAGNQDIRRADRGTPGYACVAGPVCEPELCFAGETAWAAGSRYVTRGNWATYTPYSGSALTVTLYAGQTIEAGVVHFSAPVGGRVTITVDLNDGFRFDPDASESLKVQDYATAPSGNPSPGLFDWKRSCPSGLGATCSIEVDASAFYGVHADVQQVVDCLPALTEQLPPVESDPAIPRPIVCSATGSSGAGVALLLVLAGLALAYRRRG